MLRKLPKSFSVSHHLIQTENLKIPWHFPDILENIHFSLTQHKIPWQFPDLEKIKISLTFPWRVWTLYIAKGVRPLEKKNKNWFSRELSLNAGQKYCRMLQGEHSAILSTFIKLPFVIKSFVLSIFELRLATECGTSQSLVMTQILFAIYYLLGVVLVPGAWVRGTRNFVESKTGASFGFEQEGSYMGAHFSLPEIKIKYIQRAI